MPAESREQAVDRMLGETEAHAADANVGFWFATALVMQGVT